MLNLYHTKNMLTNKNKYHIIDFKKKDFLLNNEEMEIIKEKIINSKSTGEIKIGYKKKNDTKRLQLSYCSNEWKKYPEIQKKMNMAYIMINEFVCTDTHMCSPMTILLSLPGCKEQDCHMDYSNVTSDNINNIEIPYIIILPLHSRYLLYK